MYHKGQRWFSEAEPELGLGIVIEVESKTVLIDFPAAQQQRNYSSKHAPLKRHLLAVGDEIQLEDGSKAVVEQIQEQNGIFFYLAKETIIPEMILKSQISLSKAQDKLVSGNFDSQKLFKLRYESLLFARHYQSFKDKGLMGPKVSLIPHQAYITHEVANRIYPRVLLSDEVGLGKTIEACLIMNSMLMQNRINSVLIVVPDSLVFQWFAELKLKFYHDFKTISEDQELSLDDVGDTNLLIVGIKRFTRDERLQAVLLDKEWDMAIIDEAHRLQWSTEKASAEYLLAKQLARQCPSILLLTATPEILGQQGHYARLHLLDEQKFASYESFQMANKKYYELIPVIKKIIANEHTESDLSHFFSKEEMKNFNNHEELIQALVDRHGTGRIYIRNTRANLDKNHTMFPERIALSKKIELSNHREKDILESKVALLLEEITKNAHQKFLVLCHSKKLVLAIAKLLKEYTNTPIALFHSDQGQMERDRQAAYFADPEGARIMLCTEVGSEGRNFEFASHLFMFDIPNLPDQLEQRIGRLDRIGQKNDIQIHIPYIGESTEEIIFEIHSKIFNAFRESPVGAAVYVEDHFNDFHHMFHAEYDQAKLSAFIKKHIQGYQQIKNDIENARDMLLELNSFNQQKAQEVITGVANYNKTHDLKAYLANAFETLGVNNEELNEHTYAISPSENLRVPVYPGLGDIISVSYDREFALKRDDIRFMSWEHPIAQGTIDLFVSSEVGNCAVVTHNAKLPFPLALEVIVKLECINMPNIDSKFYLPLTPIRVLIDASGQDLTAKFPKKKVDEMVTDLGRAQVEQLGLAQIKTNLLDLVKKSEVIAKKKSQKYISEAVATVQHRMNLEINRLQDLAKVNPLIGEDEVKHIEIFKNKLISEIQNAPLGVDSIRLIIG